MFRNLIIILTLFAFASFGAIGQNIQWASGVDAQNNNYDKDDWSANKVIGAPDAMPYGELNPNAFRLKSEKTNGGFTLTFDKPQIVRQVIIFENFNPGRIERVFIYDENKNRYPIFEEGYANKDPFGVLSIPVSGIDAKIVKVEIRVNAGLKNGWAQIDAVGITQSTDPSIGIQVLKELGEDKRLEILSQNTYHRNLGLGVNSVYNEVKPIITSDGSRLYFTRQYAPTNVGGAQDLADIYYSENVNGAWSEAKNMGSPLNNKNPNGVTAITADGNQLLLINEYTSNGGVGNGLSITQRKGDGWEAPRKVNIEAFVNLNNFVDFTLSPNGDVMVMAIETKESLGDQDLYISFYKGNEQWTKPKNIGATLNTSKAEFSPFIAPDGLTMYFASEGHGGFGKSDIFYTKRLDDTWLNWSAPVNLGPTVNTAEWDGYFTIAANSNVAYVVSQQGSRAGSRDIYQVRVPPQLTPERTITLKGRVFDANTKLPLAAELTLLASSDTDRKSALKSDIQGNYSVNVVPKINYDAAVRAEKYNQLIEGLGMFPADGDSIFYHDFYLTRFDEIEPQPKIIAQSSTAPALAATLAQVPVVIIEEKFNVDIDIDLDDLDLPLSLSFIKKDKFTDKVITHGTLAMGVNTTDNLATLEAIENNIYTHQMYAQNAALYLFAEANGYYKAADQIQSEEWTNSGSEPFVIYMTPIVKTINTFDAIIKVPTRSINNPTEVDVVRIKTPVELPPLLQVIGRVLDEKTMEPLVANLLVNSQISKINNRLTTTAEGDFEIENPEYDVYNYEALLDGYYSKKGSIKVEEMEKNGLVEVTVLLTPIEAGITLALPNMLFVQSKPELLEVSFPALDSVGNVMIENPALEILLSGHTDGIGDTKLNQQLSEDRVAAVKQYLVDLGIDPRRIDIEAFGGRKPIASNAREETRRLNRRVEVTIMKY